MDVKEIGDEERLDVEEALAAADWVKPHLHYERGRVLAKEVRRLRAILCAIDPAAIKREEQEKYANVFNWLLGEDGDFPPSEPGRRYNWRGELKTRLATILQSSPADQGPAQNIDKVGGDRLAVEVAKLIERGVIDSRSPVADALLNYATGVFFGPVKVAKPARKYKARV